MTTLREAAQQALEALEMLAQPTKTNSETPRYKAHKAAITALRAALAQQEQEPVAWRHKGAGHFTVTPLVSKFPEWEPLYTAPPRREWQGLTEEEIDRVVVLLGFAQFSPPEVARAVEQALKEKNA
jgi:hypothetical protein